MRTIPEDEFLNWARERGVGIDERYSDARYLVFRPYQEFSRFWKRPAEDAALREFVGHLLNAMEPWSHVGVWSRSPRWPGRVMRLIFDDGTKADEPYDPEYVALLERAGVPFSQAVALGYDASQRAELITLLEAQARFGWCVDDDVFVLPDNGRYLLQVDHHDVVWMSCRDGSDLPRLVQFLKDRGYPLPDELPDETFKPQAWIDEQTDE